MTDLQPADECECRDIFTAVENFSQLALKVDDVGLEAITLPHFDGEKVVVILLDLLTGGILSEECLSYLFKIAECSDRE